MLKKVKDESVKLASRCRLKRKERNDLNSDIKVVSSRTSVVA